MEKIVSTELRAAMAVIWVSRHQWVVAGYFFAVLGLLALTWEFPQWVYVNLFVTAPSTVFIVVTTTLGLWVCSKFPDPDHDIPKARHRDL